MKTTTRFSMSLTFLTALALVAGPVAAQDAADKVASEIKVQVEGFNRQMAAYARAYRSAKTDEEKIEARSKAPRAEETFAVLEKLADEAPSNPAVLEAYSWMMRYGRRAGGEDLMASPEFYGKLKKHHFNSEKLAEMLPSLMSGGHEARAFLEDVAENSEVKRNRGMALYTMGYPLLRGTGEDQARGLVLMEKLVQEHPDLEIRGRNLAKLAEGKVFAAKNLAIGKEAPEIVGKNVDGEEMKLSDYRGKVVVIDFWGDW